MPASAGAGFQSALTARLSRRPGRDAHPSSMPRSEQYQYNGDVPTLTDGRTAAAGQTAPQSLEDVVLAVAPLSNPQPAPVSPVLQPGHPTGPVGTTPYVSRPL